jgi:hypothetical protein
MPASRKVELLREDSVTDVAEFIAQAATDEDGDLAGRAEIVFTQVDPMNLASHYADYNVRSRQFRVIETFFVEYDEDNRVTALVSTDALFREQKTFKIQLMIVKSEPGEDPALRVREVISGVEPIVRKFVPGLSRLRVIYVYEPSLNGALGGHVSKILMLDHDRAGFIEETRIANETGPGREAVLLSFGGPSAMAGVEDRSDAAGRQEAQPA